MGKLGCSASHQPPVPEIMHIGPQVMKYGGRGGRETREDLDEPAFFSDKYAPSGEKVTEVGCSNPEKTTDSENPVGKVPAWTGLVVKPRRQVIAVQTMDSEEIYLLIMRISKESRKHV